MEWTGFALLADEESGQPIPSFSLHQTLIYQFKNPLLIGNYSDSFSFKKKLFRFRFSDHRFFLSLCRFYDSDSVLNGRNNSYCQRFYALPLHNRKGELSIPCLHPILVLLLHRSRPLKNKKKLHQSVRFLCFFGICEILL